MVTDESGMGFLLVILQDRLVQCLKVTSVAGNHSWGFADFEMGRLVMKRKHLRTDLTGVGLVTSLNKTRWVILIGWWYYGWVVALMGSVPVWVVVGVGLVVMVVVD